jgi:hypothetical protein
MYSNGLLGATAGTAAGIAGTAGATLPFTGLNLVWLTIGGFALLMAGGALWRIVPRVPRRHGAS